MEITKEFLNKQGITVDYCRSTKEINGIEVDVLYSGEDDFSDHSWLWITWDTFRIIERVLQIHKKFPDIGSLLSIFEDDTVEYKIETIEHHINSTNNNYCMFFHINNHSHFL